MSKITHYYPDALVVFVKGFREVETATSNQILKIQTKELMSCSLTMTVANSPCTFSLTLNDIANRFISNDNPVQEIQNLNDNAKFQLQHDPQFNQILKKDTDTILGFEFDGYNSGNSQWLNFEYGTLVDIQTQTRHIIYYERDPKLHQITSRWAFDTDGSVIRVSKDIDETTFSDSASNGKIFPITVDGASSKKYFQLLKFKNQDFITKYQTTFTGVNDFSPKGRCKIEPMDRLVIFLSKRYIKDNNGNYIVNEAPTTQNGLIRAFTGLVNTVQQSYNESSGNVITVNGEDVTKWLHLSVVPINPAAVQGQADNLIGSATFGKFDLNFYTNIFQHITTPDVIKILCLGEEGLSKNDRARLADINHASIKFRGISVYRSAIEETLNSEEISYDTKTGKFIVKRSGKQVNSFSSLDNPSIMADLFQKSQVHVVDPTKVNNTSDKSKQINLYLTYNTNFRMPTLFQTEFQTRRDICAKAASDSNFNFYADRNGHIWFHPPRYSNAWILTAENSKLFVIDDDSVINYAFIEDDTNVYSTCIVNSEPDITKGVVGEGIENFNRGDYTDEIIMFKYGIKILTVSNPFIAKIGGTASSFKSGPATFYAKMWLQKLLANRLQGQITITGRAEIDPGYPVYIPLRNMIYWVETVEHSFTFGGTFTTTLHLSYGHKPWESIPELLTQSYDVIHATDGHISIIHDLVTNQPTTTNTGIRKVVPDDTTKINPFSDNKQPQKITPSKVNPPNKNP